MGASKKTKPNKNKKKTQKTIIPKACLFDSQNGVLALA